MKDPNKKKIFIGLFLIIAAFVCMLGVFYVVSDMRKAELAEFEALQEQLAVLNTEKELALNKAGLDLERLVQEARDVYGEEERARNEGYLWIDRDGETFVVTLGALNGLNVGSYVSIYDDDGKQIGLASVKVPLDIVSYVQPVNKSIGEFDQDYYRVVFGE